MEKKMSKLSALERDWGVIPDDFPCVAHAGAVPGAQPKLLMSEYKGRFYSPGCTPPEVYRRWEICQDLASQLAQKSVESKAGKRAHMLEVDILAQYLPRLIAQHWTSEREARWVIRRVAQMLEWPVPQAALDSAS
jgi:hypothetical protein